MKHEFLYVNSYLNVRVIIYTTNNIFQFEIEKVEGKFIYINNKDL